MKLLDVIVHDISLYQKTNRKIHFESAEYYLNKFFEFKNGIYIDEILINAYLLASKSEIDIKKYLKKYIIYKGVM
jgi:hypothetical protein